MLGCNQKKLEKKSADNGEKKMIRTFQPEMRIDSILFETTVNFIPLDTVYMAFAVAGLLKDGDVYMKKGMRFSFNQLLAQLDIRQVFEKLRTLKSALNVAIRQLIQQLEAIENSDVSKWRVFLENIDPSKRLPVFPLVNSSEESLLVKQLGIASKYARLQLLELEIEAHFYFAPFKGIIDEVYLSNGKYIRAQQHVATLVSEEKGLLIVNIPKAYKSRLLASSSLLFSSKTNQSIKIKAIKWVKKDKNDWMFELELPKNLCNLSTATQYKFRANLKEKYFAIPASLFKNRSLHVLANGKSVKRKVFIFRRSGDTCFVKGLKVKDRCVLPFPAN